MPQKYRWRPLMCSCDLAEANLGALCLYATYLRRKLLDLLARVIFRSYLVPSIGMVVRDSVFRTSVC